MPRSDREIVATDCVVRGPSGSSHRTLPTPIPTCSMAGEAHPDIIKVLAAVTGSAQWRSLAPQCRYIQCTAVSRAVSTVDDGTVISALRRVLGQDERRVASLAKARHAMM